MTLEPYRRMPTAFGPAPGPRNVPADADPPNGPARQAVVSFAAQADPGVLAAFLPEGVELRRSTMNVQLVTFENLHWFAGRGYDALSVTIPVRYASVEANFLTVMWENAADPILTGRDELGFPKLFADIDVTTAAEARRSGVLRAQASWDRTPFFRAEVHDLEPADPVTSGLPLLTHRYVPAVGNLGAADADYLTVAAPGPAWTTTSSAVGAGTFAFEPVTWQQVPLQHPAMNALAAIDVEAVGPVRLVCSEGSV